MPDPDELAASIGLKLFDHQREYLLKVTGDTMAHPQRTCLYFKTGAGKTITSLLALRLQGMEDCVVIAPPSTHKQWEAAAQSLGMDIWTMSHAKFRMKGTKLSRHLPIIADEFHMFGGHKGQGWRKLEQVGRVLQAPMVLMSATPNYNDAERCYCIQRILDPHGTKGGYLQFLYTHCITEQNMFGIEPKVNGFRNHPDAASFLCSLPGVFYLPDERVVDIVDIPYYEDLPDELSTHSYNRRDHRMVASRIEMTHTARLQGLVNEDGLHHPEVLKLILDVIEEPGSILIYCNHATIAYALSGSLHLHGIEHETVTGTTGKNVKAKMITDFCHKKFRVLIGTASLATGTDGMDRVCNTLLIVDDTDDDALRRQLIGRILPRGEFGSLADKKIFRLVPQT